MTWTPPHDFVPNDDATSGALQTLTDALNYLHGGAGGQRPTIEVTTGTFTAAYNVWTTPTGLTASNDTDNGWNSSTGVYTVATPGLWVWQVSVAWTVNGTGNRGVTVTNTSGAYNWANAATQDNQGRCSIATLWRHAAGSTAAPSVIQGSGGPLNATALTFLGVWLCG